MTKAEIVKAARAVWRMRQPEIARRIKAGDARREIENRQIEDRAMGIDDCDDMALSESSRTGSPGD